MEKTSIILQFEINGMKYVGWATPSDQRGTGGYAKSYHVVLNQVFFGNMANDHGQWLIDEQRPQELVKAMGHCLSSSLVPAIDEAPSRTPRERGNTAIAVEKNSNS